MKTITVSIKGGIPLSGAVTIASNKNAILPAIAASILTTEPMEYLHIPRSPDVLKLCSILEKIGAEVTLKGADDLKICCKKLATHVLPPSEDTNDMQAGYLLAGPLLARFGKAVIPMSSGCRLGYRGPEDHAQYLGELGVSFSQIGDSIHFELDDSIKDERISINGPMKTPRREITYNSAFVTPTENILMLLAGTSRYETEVSGIAQEPHVAQLIDLLRKMGAHIEGKGSTVTVTGANKLHGATFTPEPDHVDYFGFCIMAVMTKSDLLIKFSTPCSRGIDHMSQILMQTGVVLEKKAEGMYIKGSESSFTPSKTFPHAGENMYKMIPNPWPGFPVDCLPSFIAWSSMNPNPLTSTKSINWLYTDGLKYVPVMKEMGANIAFSDDQRALVHGTPNGNPYTLTRDVTAADVIEGTRALISCALAGGHYTIKNVQYILRRNPDFFEILKNLGADITII